MNKNLDYVAKLEKVIKQKYGDIAILNPKSLWTIEDEKIYQESIKNSLYEKNVFSSSFQEVIENTVSAEYNIDSRLIKREEIGLFNKCGECGNCSFLLEDDLYMLKFGCCKNCFLKNEFKYKKQGII